MRRHHREEGDRRAWFAALVPATVIAVNTLRRRPFVVLSAFLLAALTGCAAPVAGRPVPAAGFQDEPQPRSTPTPSADIPVPRRVDGIDPCGLLAPEDLAPLGGAAGGPLPHDPTPDTCTHPLASAPANAAGAGFGGPYRTAAARQPRGLPVSVDGHSTWLYCELVDTHQTCTATTAIRDDRTLLTLLSAQGSSAADTTDALYRLTEAALHRLPPG